MKITHLYSKKLISISVFASLLYAILACIAGVHFLAAVGIAALLFLSVFWRFKMRDLPWWGKQLLLVTMSVIIFIIVQFAVGTHIASIGFIKFLLNIMIVYGIICLVSAITTSMKAGIISVFVFSLVLAVVDHFVVQTRSYEIQFADIKSFTTALSVAGGYEFTVSPYCAGALLVSVPVFILLITNKFPKFKGVLPRSVNSLVSLVCVALSVTIVSTAAGADMIGYRVKYWKYRTSQYNGFYLGLVKSITASSIKMPDGYTVEGLEQGLVSLLGKDVTADVEIKDNEKRPNVIVIMNETFSDMNYVSTVFGHGGIPTNIDPLEYFNSFKDEEANVIKGDAYASIYGGNTANSEFEFLTGNSMAFIEHTTVPYNNLVNENNAYSIVDIFNQYGYYTVGMHPENKTNWSRHKIYDYFEFDEQYFLRADNTFVDGVKLTEEDLYRGHVSDKTVYEKIIGLYENKEEGTPLFTFAITMHGHGGYNTEGFEYTVTAEGSESTKLNEYLSSIKRSDDDLKTLIDYFKEADEETVIVFFGDHQPSLDDEVYEQFYGLSDDSPTEETMKKYLVPYMMWTNRSFEESDGSGYTTSLNYLGARILDVLDMEKTPYLKLVQEVEKKMPVLNAFGYWDKNYVFHPIEDFETIDSVHEGDDMSNLGGISSSPNKLPTVMLYYWAEYNMLKDNKNKLVEYFKLNYSESEQTKKGIFSVDEK